MHDEAAASFSQATRLALPKVLTVPTVPNHAKAYFFIVALLILLCTAPQLGWASTSDGGGALPYEAWLTKLQSSVTGPVAFSISIIGIVVAGSVMIFGGDLNSFFRSMIFLVLVMALLVGAQNIMSSFFGHGALIGSPAAWAHQTQAVAQWHYVK